MKFPYARYRDYFMPIIPIRLRLGEIRMATEALVDSGAASSIFDAQFAEALGIEDLEQNGVRVEFEGVSGHRLIGYQHDVTLEVGGHSFPNVTIAFSHDMPDNATNILGQQGFFDICPIKFTYRKKEIEVMTASIQPRGES
jgi:Aspartyl protease